MAKLHVFLMASTLFLAARAVCAQTFGGAQEAQPQQNGISFPQTPATPQEPAASNDNRISDEELSKALAEEKAALNSEELMEQVFVPGGGLDVLSKPTEDGSKRGDLAVVELNDDGNSRRAEKIFLYYDNFRISSYLSNSAACDARFIVLTNLDRKLVSLDVKLVWPGMTTALSFSNVEPNTPTYLNYTLMGNGCYNMDQMPNIIVNRCRVRGMNSAECADKIVWLSAIQNK